MRRLAPAALAVLLMAIFAAFAFAHGHRAATPFAHVGHRPAWRDVPIHRKPARAALSAAVPVEGVPGLGKIAGEWHVAYADGFGAGGLTGWKAAEHDNGCCSNSNEIAAMRPSKITQSEAGLELLCSKESVASGKPYTCGSVDTTGGFTWRPNGKQRFAFQCVVKVPSWGNWEHLGEDPSCWSTDRPWTDEVDYFEFWGWNHAEYFAGIPCWLPKAGAGSDTCHELYKAVSEIPDPEKGLHTYTTVINADNSVEEWIDGVHRWNISPSSTPNTTEGMHLILTHSLRQSSSLTGTAAYTVRSIAVYEVGTGNTTNEGVAPGTVISGEPPPPPPPPAEEVPKTPTGCTATPHDEGTTAWVSIACQPSTGATSYTLWRTGPEFSSTPGAAWTTGSVPSFSNHALVTQKDRFCYQVAAVNTKGSSPRTPDFCVTA